MGYAFDAPLHRIARPVERFDVKVRDVHSPPSMPSMPSPKRLVQPSQPETAKIIEKDKSAEAAY
jgi:hypothetical protein